MSESEIALEIPAAPAYLSMVRSVVTVAASLEPGLGDERIEDLRIVVSEATTNAIEAHAKMGSDERITIRCNLEHDRIEVEVRDRGEGIAAHKTDNPLPSEPQPEGGFGLPLMRILADEMKIKSVGDGTSVQLVVYTSHGQG